MQLRRVLAEFAESAIGGCARWPFRDFNVYIINVENAGPMISAVRPLGLAVDDVAGGGVVAAEAAQRVEVDVQHEGPGVDS